jgi:hypothetical protein
MRRSAFTKLKQFLSFRTGQEDHSMHSWDDQPTEHVQRSMRRLMVSKMDMPTGTTGFQFSSARAMRSSVRDLKQAETLKEYHESRASRMRLYCQTYAEVIFGDRVDTSLIERAIQRTMRENPDLKAAFEPLVYHGLSDQRIAIEIGVSISEVRDRWSRSRTLVRGFIEEQLDER